MVDSFGFNDGIEQQKEDNRIRQYLSDLNNRTNDPEEMMLEIMEVLNETVEPIPEVGKFYTFVYNAKTPGVQYDQHPLIACVDLFPWGFRGVNFHWEDYRNYTWMEVAGQLRVISDADIDGMKNIPYAKFLLNREK